MQKDEKAPFHCIEDDLPDTDSDHDNVAPLTNPLDDVVPLQPAKRPTRQWAAWTREEEESFFTALRQVGKNFEKITCRVQSKNKDQVRHYYYRLVRRMNKLLGPDLCLDAKNSKDTNAAMLRWWSLLEKYSCKASKLHLKPRRFKIFVEALEHQLLKDRKKNIKKRLAQGDHSSPHSFNLSNSSANDSRSVKIVLVESQSVPKAGNGKGSSRRNVSLGVTKTSGKGDGSLTKSTRQRRKTAAIKRWEKAAMAGVSLVADAAEHVERIASGKEADQLGGLTVLSAQAMGCSIEQKDPGPSSQVQANTLTKIKLQLFPINDETKKALEMDKHNPHLELTLSTRKRISSVVEHLGRKWGNSRVTSGELMLFPFDIQRENLSGYQRWTHDSVASAAEVYAMIGSPQLFRLRYGWIISNELQSVTPERSAAVASNSCVHGVEEMRTTVELNLLPAENKDLISKHVSHSLDNHETSGKNINSAVCDEAIIVDADDNNNHLEPSDMLVKAVGSCDGCDLKIMENAVGHKLKKTPAMSPGEWADSLTNVSVSDVLTDVTDDVNNNCVEPSLFRSSRCLEAPFTCDSFDAAIAAHISGHNKSFSSGLSPQSSSIWDAEVACDEFSFQKRAITSKQILKPALAAVSFGCDGTANTSSGTINTNVQVSQIEAIAEDLNEYAMDDCPSEPHNGETSVKDFSSLTDIYWPDSLGPLELDVPACKYYSEDLILSDSLSGLNRLIASSLDAFQHCSFFPLDDKGSSQAAGAQSGASFTGKLSAGGNAEVRSLQV